MSSFLVSATKIGVVSLACWGAWWALVLQRVAKSSKEWGPRWLAHGLSSVLYKFGIWYLDWTDDLEEWKKKGIWDGDKHYMAVWHPHGQFTISALYFFAHFWAKKYPSGRLQFTCVAPLLLNVPGLAEYLLLCNARSIDRTTVGKLLDAKATVGIQPGGIAEQVATDNRQERIFFPEKLGFIRMAVERGVPLLPIYCFGENQIFKTAPWAIKFNTWVYRTTGIGNLVIIGQGGLPNTPLLPNPGMLPIMGKPLSIRCGAPVDIGPAIKNPSEEDVKKAFKKYCDELAKVFNTHKDKLLPPEVAARGLTVVMRGGGHAGELTEFKI